MKAAFTARVNFRDTSRGSREYFLLVEKSLDSGQKPTNC